MKANGIFIWTFLPFKCKLAVYQRFTNTYSKPTSIYVSRKTPLVIDGSVFKGVNKEKCVLYVPQDSYQDYWLAEGWGDFKNIVEYDATKVGNSVVDKEIKEVARYTANGQRLDTPTKGLNIVRYSDGSVRKELHN